MRFPSCEAPTCVGRVETSSAVNPAIDNRPRDSHRTNRTKTRPLRSRGPWPQGYVHLKASPKGLTDGELGVHAGGIVAGEVADQLIAPGWQGDCHPA